MNTGPLRKLLIRIPIEAICWLTGLLVLATANVTSAHFSLCPLRNAGFDFCPGCGLGKAITLLFNGDITASFETHPLGIFALIILSFRIVDLTKQYFQNYGKSY